MTGRVFSRRDSLLTAVVVLLLTFCQAPGRIAPDTKLDLTADPLGFLSRAAHLWSPDAPMGQIQNQAYGYFFPHGSFFAAGHLLGLPPWIVQRLWWALLLYVGFLGVVRLAEALRVGSYPSRVLAGVIFVLSPRVLTTLGSISSETLPMMLAPWVLIPVVRVLDVAPENPRPLWQYALRSACAVALMGAVNAVATLAATGVAVVWWLLAFRRGSGSTPPAEPVEAPGGRSYARRWAAFGAWWALGLALACLWWLVPLLMLSRVSPPFLDFIESSRVTTEWTSLTEVLRGTSSWTPFVSPERAAGAVLVSEPAAVLATVALAAAGLAGLSMSRMPFRRRFVVLVVLGVLLMCLGYPGALGSPLAERVDDFLDGAGAPLRNIHKFEPFVRIPLVLGVAHLLARVTVPVRVPDRARIGRSETAGRRFAAALLVVAATIGAGSLVWTGGIAPAGSYRAIPDYWRQAADWIADAQQGDATPSRTLLVPGAPFADQLWGLTRDEPMQALASTPWSVRDAIPLTPPGAIRALDSIQRDLAAGRGSPGLAATLRGQGVGYLILRADLDPSSSRSARPLLVQQALHDSPGVTAIKTFGPPTASPTLKGFVTDNGLHPKLPAVTIYALAGGATTGPALTPLNQMPRVAGGPESLLAIQDAAARTGQPPLGPSLLMADARRAGLGEGPGLIVTDSPADRETDFGRVDDHSSAIRAPDDPRLTKNAAADYPVDGQPLVHAQWLLDNQPDQITVRTSGSAADATQPGQTSPASSAAAAFDDDPSTAWVSRGLDSAVGQWLSVDFAKPVSNLAVTLTTAEAIGPDVSSILVTTDAGSTVAQGIKPGEPVRIVAPSRATRHVEIRAIDTANGTAGNQFALHSVQLSDAATGQKLAIRQRVVLPPLTTADRVREWVLQNELGARSECVTQDDGTVRCSPALGLDPESPGTFSRALSVPHDVDVAPAVVLRPKPGSALSQLLAVPGRITVDGPSSVSDPRGNTSAMVDGDPRTTWTAPEQTGRKSSKPTVTIRLPQPAEVSGLRIQTRDGYPARPTRVTVNLGSGKQSRTVGKDGVVPLTPARTDKITLTVDKTEDLLDTNDLGFTTQAPAGITELEVLGATSNPPVDPEREIVIGCDTDPSGPLGLGLTAAGQLVRLQVRTTAGALRDGEPVVATPCPGPPLRLAAGEQEVLVNPGDAFTVDAASLTTGDPTDDEDLPVTTQPTPTSWSSTSRTVPVDAADVARVLSVPESTNPGWHARLDGVELKPVVVDGWQQGWVVPAGMSGDIALTFDLDGPYRTVLLVGLLLVAVLFVLAFVPVRRRPAPLPPYDAPRWLSGSSLAVAAVAGLAAAWLVAGWPGLLVAAFCGAATRFAGRTARVTAVFVAMMTAGVLLAAGPWHSGLPYTGYSALPQLAALVALSVLASSTFLPTRRIRTRQ
ncbi:MAG: alpha-(1-_3)-arabinofuranosyltransferase [Gordonia sp. (in: high G+C Gram-positive bacteria)]